METKATIGRSGIGLGARRVLAFLVLGLLHTGCAGHDGMPSAWSRSTEELVAEDPTVRIGPPIQPFSWKVSGGQLNEHFGYSVASAGDVNGDGYDDLIVGATDYDGSSEIERADEGRAYVFLGSASGLSEEPAWTSGPGAGYSNAAYGWSVAGAGDVNGDGYDDVIVGAPNVTNGQADEGRAFLFYGSPTGPEATPSWTGESNQVAADYGDCVASAGDVNGDGFADVLVGASDFDDGQVHEGLVYVYLGSAEGLANHALWTAESNQANALFGHSAATAGDVNGDGYSDVIIGAPLYDSPEVDEGRASVWLGGPLGLESSPAWTVEGNQREGWFGWSVASAGDVNHDGYDDVLVGAPNFDDGELDEGRVLLYLGSPLGLAMTHAWGGEGDAVGTMFGWSVAPAGDLNADGHADVIIGAASYDGATEDEGRAFVYLGTETGLRFEASAEIAGDRAGGNLGWSVASAGDVNADGYPDVAAGAPAGNGEVVVRLGVGPCSSSDADGDGVLDCVDRCPHAYAPTLDGCPAGGGGGGTAGTGAGGTGAGGTGAGGTGAGGTGAGGTGAGGTGAGATGTGGATGGSAGTAGTGGTSTGGTGAVGGTATGGGGSLGGSGGSDPTTGGSSATGGSGAGTGGAGIDPGRQSATHGVNLDVGCGCRVPVGQRTNRMGLPLAFAALAFVGWRRRRRYS